MPSIPPRPVWGDAEVYDDLVYDDEMREFVGEWECNRAKLLTSIQGGGGEPAGQEEA